MYAALKQQRKPCHEIKWLNAHVIINVGHLNHRVVSCKCNFFHFLIFFVELNVIGSPFLLLSGCNNVPVIAVVPFSCIQQNRLVPSVFILSLHKLDTSYDRACFGQVVLQVRGR